MMNKIPVIMIDKLQQKRTADQNIAFLNCHSRIRHIVEHLTKQK